MKILAISGSLRRESSNTALLRALAKLAPSGVDVTLYKGLGSLPLFNPDIENKQFAAVLDLREQIKAADGVIIASPEYAHGITGALKNGLDWVVGSGEFTNKSVAILNASPRSSIADHSLKEIIKTMDAKLIWEASLTIPLPTNKMEEAAIVSHPILAPLVQQAIHTFVAHLRK